MSAILICGTFLFLLTPASLFLPCAAMTRGAAAPRTELIHHLHSPKYYPGNCSENCWGGRNCPAVITSGALKLMLGYVGDPRLLQMNESTRGKRVPFGATGGICGLAGFAGKQTEALALCPCARCSGLESELVSACD